MSDTIGFSNITSSNSSLYSILRNCANLQSYENLSDTEDYNDFNDVWDTNYPDYYKMMSINSCSTSGNISSRSFSSEESFGENIIEENGRISLAYENLRNIPRRIAEKFAVQTKCLDLSYNNFQNLSFLAFFEELHTLILDHNVRLDVNSLPYLPNLKILWINNCDISNITDWVHRIKKQCSVLEQLSIMGNPGIQNLFNLCSLTPPTLLDPPLTNSVVTDYREYILYVLPQLEYLDGTPRCNQYNNNDKSFSTSSSSSISIENNSSNCSDKNRSNKNKSFETKDHSKISPTLSFKDIFRLKSRNKSCYSVSTN